MADTKGWDPIKIFSYLYGLDEGRLTKEQIEGKVRMTKPEDVKKAGEVFLAAADAVGGEVGGNGASEIGVQARIRETAEALRTVWTGRDAAKVQVVLQRLHATAGAIGDAMLGSGASLSWYAIELQKYKDSVGTVSLPVLLPHSSPYFRTPEQLITDNLARERLLEFNNTTITAVNDAMQEGLAYDLPPIEKIEFAPARQAPPISVGDSTTNGTGSQSWNPGGGSSTGTGGGGTTTPPIGTPADPTPGDRPDDQRPDDQRPDDQRPDETKPTDPPADPPPGEQERPGEGDSGTTPPGGPGTSPGEAPPVIGAPVDPAPQTQLADGSQPQSPWSTGSPPNTPNVLTNADVRPPTTVGQPPSLIGANGVIGSAPGIGTGYGSGGGPGAPGAPGSPRVGAGSGGMPFMPFMPGGGGMGESGGEERDRVYYDPEGDVWSAAHDTTPDRIG